VATKTPKSQKKSGSDEGKIKGTAAAARRMAKARAAKKPGGAKPRSFSSRVGSGRSLWFNSGETDHRTQSARRFREIVFSIAADLGGLDSLSEIQRQLVRRHASLSLMAEKMEMSLVKDEEIDVARFMGMTNTLGRVSAALGLSKQVLDITPKEELKRLLEDDHDQVNGSSASNGNGAAS